MIRSRRRVWTFVTFRSYFETNSIDFQTVLIMTFFYISIFHNIPSNPFYNLFERRKSSSRPSLTARIWSKSGGKEPKYRLKYRKSILIFSPKRTWFKITVSKPILRAQYYRCPSRSIGITLSWPFRFLCLRDRAGQTGLFVRVRREQPEHGRQPRTFGNPRRVHGDGRVHGNGTGRRTQAGKVHGWPEERFPGVGAVLAAGQQRRVVPLSWRALLRLQQRRWARWPNTVGRRVIFIVPAAATAATVAGFRPVRVGRHRRWTVRVAPDAPTVLVDASAASATVPLRFRRVSHQQRRRKRRLRQWF